MKYITDIPVFSRTTQINHKAISETYVVSNDIKLLCHLISPWADTAADLLPVQ